MFRTLVFTLCAFWSLDLSVSGAEKVLTKTRLKVGANQTNFLNVNRNDAQAAIKAFAKNVGQKRGYAVEPQVEIYDNTEAFAKGILEQGVQLAIMDTWDYLTIEPASVMEPLFVFLEPGGPLEPYLLLTLRDKGAGTLSELRGLDIIVLENTNANLSRQWLETLVLEHNLGGVPQFFKKAEFVNKASAAVLPVFFGKSAACVVDQSAFVLMSELNPQVGRRLRVIVKSKPYLDTVLCVRRDGWPSEQERKDLIDSLKELEQTPEGQQILTVFKVSKLEPFQDEQLNTVKELKATHDRLSLEGSQGATPSKGPSSQGKEAP